MHRSTPSTRAGKSVQDGGQAVRASAVPVITAKGSLSDLDDHQVVTRDRALFKAMCYGVCRTLPRLEALAALLLKTPFKARDADVQALLLLGIYQLLYLRIPAHAAVGETAGAARQLGKEWATKVLNGCLRRLTRAAGRGRPGPGGGAIASALAAQGPAPGLALRLACHCRGQQSARPHGSAYQSPSR